MDIVEAKIKDRLSRNPSGICSFCEQVINLYTESSHILQCFFIHLKQMKNMSCDLEFTTRLDNREEGVIYIPPNCHKLVKRLSKAVGHNGKPSPSSSVQPVPAAPASSIQSSIPVLVNNPIPPPPPSPPPPQPQPQRQPQMVVPPINEVSGLAEAQMPIISKVENLRTTKCIVSHIVNHHKKLCARQSFHFADNLYICFGDYEYFLCRKTHFREDDTFKQLLQLNGVGPLEDPAWKPSKPKIGAPGCHIEGCRVVPTGYFRIKGIVPNWSTVDPDKVPYLYFCSFCHLDLYRSLIRYGFISYLITYLPNAKRMVAIKNNRSSARNELEEEDDGAEEVEEEEEVIRPPTKKTTPFILRKKIEDKKHQANQTTAPPSGKPRRSAFNTAVAACTKRKASHIENDYVYPGEDGDDEDEDDVDDDGDA
ncbi:hypothetical protein SAMD00019534_041110, partial [Acytostelium subglobosum LB1]|uniref:hypothetical protein n=1 Tax=Acytostelium subglobosum LB1 TaxID=1410327 RepID=UPI000644FCB2